MKYSYKKTDFLRVGRDVAAYQDDIIQQRSNVRIQARTQFLEGYSKRETQKRPQRIRWGWAICMASVVAAAASTMVWFRSPKELSFTVAEQRGQVGAWIASSLSELPVYFSDGTHIQLRSGSQARVIGVSHVGANVLLERGKLHADVVHTSKSRWSMHAGPFEVRVTGTRFDLSWDPSHQLLTLDLLQGSVVVSGCAMQQQSVVAGQSLRMTCRDGHSIPVAEHELSTLASSPASSAFISPLVPEPSPSSTILNRVEAYPSASIAQNIALPIVNANTKTVDKDQEPTTKSPELIASQIPPQESVTPTSITPMIPLSWKDLIAQGKSKEAFALIINDFDAECQRANAQDLMLLADLARAMHDLVRAKKALLTVRTRFPLNSYSVTAAFLLGRFAQNSKNYAEAIQWFAIITQAEPSGSLAREALGRLIEVKKAQGDRIGAKHSAQEYMNKFPKGPHAELAKSLLVP